MLLSRASEKAEPMLIRHLIIHVCAIAAVVVCVNYGLYKTSERKVAEEMLKHRTIKWEHDGKTEYFFVFNAPRNSVDWDSGECYSGPPSTDLYDRNWKVSDGEGRAFDLQYKNDGLDVMFFYDGTIGRREFISYEQLFKSKDIELIDSNKVWDAALEARR